MLRTTLTIANSAIRQIFGKEIINKCYYSNISTNRLKTYQLASPIQRNYSFIGNVEFIRSFLHPPQEHKTNLTRTLTKFSLQKGKRKTVKAVLKRFYRLDWGMWIRGKCGRQKKLYKKSFNRKRRLRQHVFTNATQSWLLEKMVTSYWRKPRYYVDDPYQPYHVRPEFPLTRQKPWEPL